MLVKLATVPLARIFGSKFGPFVNLISCIYNSGTLTWSYSIALYRVLFIVAQKWLTNTIGLERFLKFLIWYGVLEVLMAGTAYHFWDDKGSITKSSFHYSSADMDIILSYQVFKYYVFTSELCSSSSYKFDISNKPPWKAKTIISFDFPVRKLQL